MKKIINKKLYDTTTARELAVWNNDYAVNDFNHACETLRIKKTGEFFLHGEGGPMSKYARFAYGSTNSWTGGELIIPLSYEEAQKWAEERLTADEFIKIFGEPEGGDDVYISAKISAVAKAKLDRMRGERGESISKVIEKFVLSEDE